MECRVRRVGAPEEIAQGLGLRLLGTVPALPARARRAAVTGSASPADVAWQGRLTEAVDALRTLLLKAAGEGPHVVMVTSALGGEGKTSLAGQLAVSLARAWRKTLLIDGDVRKPAAHQLFNLPVEPGLCEVLRGEMEPADVVKATSISRLWLMPSGHWDSHAVQALAQEGSSALFDQLKEQYDFILVDSSPVLPVADALVLGQHVEAVVLAVRCGASRLPAVYAAHHRLGTLGIPVLGAVVIGADKGLGSLEFSYPRTPASR
jgi:capsular exopolysaccharide synthesis family protein